MASRELGAAIDNALHGRTMPVFAVEQRLRTDLPLNLVSIRQRLDEQLDQVETARA